MKQISVGGFFMGRDATHPDELTQEIDANASVTVERVNHLLAIAQQDGILIEDNPKTGAPVSSGWRPSGINRATPGAAIRSKHLTAQACDIFDPDGDLDDWCMDHLEILERLELWLEHPSATKGWCHLQTVAPRSGKRVFYP